MIRAAGVYFVILFCSSAVIVPARFVLLQPSLGSVGAALFGALAILVVAWFAATYAAQRFDVPRTATDRLGMGGLALLPFALLEVLLFGLRGGPGPAHWFVRSLTTPEGAIGLAANLAVWLMPLLRRGRG